jgi:CMP-N-acetylneuraminic acid synthetase
LPFVDDERGRIAVRQLQRVFVRKGSVYVARIAVERGDLFGHDCRGHVMPRERFLDINAALDLASAQFLPERRGTR